MTAQNFMEPSLLTLVETVKAARAAAQSLQITGGGSKCFIQPVGDSQSPRSLHSAADTRHTLSALGHRGIVSYEPSELVLTARAGTALAEVNAALVAAGQHLPFEPPWFGAAATVGGMVACGFAGPARPWRGAVRDAVLGVQMINGLGECLRFGGQVMKNVAGYDLARLQVGAFGRLGLLTEVSMKVLPIAINESTQMLQLDRAAALACVVALQRGPEPVTATLHQQQLLHVRFSGAAASVQAAVRRLGGETLPAAAADLFWRSVREQQTDFFTGAHALWRFSVPHAASYPDLPGSWCTEWAGALRWLRLSPVESVRSPRALAAARELGGFATQWSMPIRAAVQPASSGVRAELQRRLQLAFDPDGVFDALAAPGSL